MNDNSVEKRIIEIIDEHANDIIGYCEDVYSSGESSYFEFETSKKFASFLERFHILVEKDLAITGIKGTIKSNNGPTVSLLGELDGVYCPNHPRANKENGISHTCGHHIQQGAVLGSAIALSNPEIRKYLFGQVNFLGIPAEEYIDNSIKEQLRSEGKVKYAQSGKSELIRIGTFDDTDIVVTHHAHTYESEKADVLLGLSSSNGFITKRVAFLGKSTHAAASPHLGINALNAALLGLDAIGYIRETFRDEDSIRVNYNITKGGGVVNVIPDNAVIDMMIRGSNLDAINDANSKVNRAMEGAALALGAKVEIKDYNGYLPCIKSAPQLSLILAAEKLEEGITTNLVSPILHDASSTDIGDLTHLFPVIKFTTGGISGDLHGANFKIEDPYKAYVVPAKIMALTVYNLLSEEAKQARELLAGFKPVFNKQQYLNFKENK